jgi:hypothetical protein
MTPPGRPGQRSAAVAGAGWHYSEPIAEEFQPEAMIQRFQARARAVRQRGLPPLEGAERKRFVDQARVDFQDYAMIGDAVARLEDGVLTLTIDLRPRPDEQA